MNVNKIVFLLQHVNLILIALSGVPVKEHFQPNQLGKHVV